jgi:hypothetical protein
MHRFGLHSAVPHAAAAGRLPHWLAVAAVLAVLGTAPLARAQTPAAAPAPASPSAAAAEALALDRKLIDGAKEGLDIMTNLTYLSDVIGPRLTGSAALKRANEWTAEKMKSYGLSNVRLEPWTIPMGWERGTAHARILEPENGRTLSLASMGWTPGTAGKIEGDVVFIKAQNPGELAAYKGKLKNAIVLRGPPASVRPISQVAAQPVGERRSPAGGDRPAGFESRPQRRFADSMAFRREMSEFLRKEGAAVLLHDAAKPHGLLTISGGWGGRDRASAGDPLPSLCVAHEHYSLLYRLATRPVRTRVEIEVTNKLIPGPIAVYNTVGEIPGSEKPDEFVVLGAHLDSWDLGQGTTDNGTGSMVVLETARLLARCGMRPKRTIRFVLFSGEEQGLHGSREYVRQHKDEMARTSACIVHDTGTGRVVGLGLQGRSVLKPLLDAELTSLQELGVKEINMRSMGGSDHMAFEQAGIPGFMFQQDPAEYRLTHHSQSDTLDKAREPDLIQGTQVMAVIAMRLANMDQLLPRDKK